MARTLRRAQRFANTHPIRAEIYGAYGVAAAYLAWKKWL